MRMRGMHRANRKVSYTQARQILEKAEYGVLSTICDDGLPYGVPLSFVLSGNAIYFHCAAQGQKLDNIQHDSRVCFTAVASAQTLPDVFSVRYESAMAFGTAHIVYGEDERIAALQRLCRKYAPQKTQEQLATYMNKLIVHTTVVRLDVEYISGKSSAQ
jgi:possible 5-nitroimidazole antibiotics resistance protein, nimA-family